MFDLQYWPSMWRPRIPVLSHTKNILMHDGDWGRLPNSARLESLRLQADLSVCSKVLRKSIRVVFPPVHSLCFMASGLLGTIALYYFSSCTNANTLIISNHVFRQKNINSFHRKLYGSLHTFGKNVTSSPTAGHDGQRIETTSSRLQPAVTITRQQHTTMPAIWRLTWRPAADKIMSQVAFLHEVRARECSYNALCGRSCHNAEEGPAIQPLWVC